MDLSYKPGLKSGSHEGIKTFAAVPKPGPSQQNDSGSKQPDGNKPTVKK
jgi:hypothetical protein